MNPCTICGALHDRLWLDQSPALYCASCAQAKGDAAGTITHVLGSIFLGDAEAAAKFGVTKLAVHHDVPMYHGSRYHVPILSRRPSLPDRSDGLVDMQRLETAVRIVQDYDELRQPLLVHCKGGVERSPLVVAHFLVGCGYCADLGHAYEFLKKIRPVVADRRCWLPQPQGD